MPATTHRYSSLRSWLVTLPAAALLLLAIVFGTSAFVHGQLLSLGGHIWRDYNVLRVDMSKPDCDPNPDIAARIKKAQQAKTGSDSLFNAGPADPKALRRSLIAQRAQCRQSFQRYRYNHRVTDTASLRAFRTMELGVGRINTIGQNWQPYILVLLILSVASSRWLWPNRSRYDRRPAGWIIGSRRPPSWPPIWP